MGAIRRYASSIAARSRQYCSAERSLSCRASTGEEANARGEAISGYIKIRTCLAGKITGMVLEMADTELLKMLENEATLRAKVAEAVKVLNRSVEAAKAKAPAP